MGKVYIFAGFVTVLLVAGTYVLLISRIGLGMFRFKKKEKDTDDQAPPSNTGGRGPGGGPDGPHWV